MNYNSAMYHYLYNLQGDVIGLLDTSDNIVVAYNYDEWGKLLAAAGSLSNTTGLLNPFRYRGYVYDDETGLYYLRSRYYNPAWDRFINADKVMGKLGDIISHNFVCILRPWAASNYLILMMKPHGLVHTIIITIL